MKGFFQRIQESHSGSRKQKNDPQPSYQIWVPPAAKPNVDGNRAQKETLYYTADGQRTTTSRRPPLGSNTVYEPHVPTTGYDYMTYPSTGSGYPIPDHRYPVHVAPSSNSISGQYPSVPSRNQPLAASALPPPKPWNQYAQVTPTVHREDDPRHHKASGSRDTDRERQGKRELRARERAPTVEKYGTENPTHHESTQRDEKRRTMKDEGGEREARERRRDARKEDKDRESKDRKEKDRRRKEKEKDGGSDREIDWGRNRDREREHERSGKHKKERHLPRDTMADYRIVDSEPERNWTSGRERDPTKDLRRPPIQESRRREDLEQVRTGKAKGKEVLAGERQDKTNPVAGVSQDWRTEGFSTHLQNNKDRGERDVQSYYKRHDRAQVSDLHERRPDRRENNHSYLDKRVEPDSGAWHPVSMSQDQPVARKQHSQRDETTSDSSPRMDLPKRSKHKRHLTDSETPHLVQRTDTSLPRASSASSLTKPQRTNTNLNHLPLERSRNHVIPSEPPVQNGLQASSVPVHILQKYHSREQDIVPDKSSNTRNKNNEPTTLSSRWPFFKRNSSQKPPASFVETAPAQHVSSSKPDKQSTSVSRTATAGPSIQQAQLSHGVSKATEQLLAPAAGKHSKRYSSDVLNPVETSKTPNVVYDHHLSVLGLSKIPSASISGPSPTSLIQHEPRSQETTGYPLPRSVQPTLGMKSVNSTTESFAGPQLPVQSSSREKLFSSHVDAYSRESNPQGANTRLIPVETLVSPGQRLGPPPTPDVQPTNTSPDSQIQAPLIPSHPLSRSQGNMPVLTPFGQSQVPRNEPLHVSPILESERHVQIPALPSTGRSSSGTTPTQHENARRLPEEHGHSNQLHKPPSRDFGPTENGLKHPQAASIYPTTTQQRMGGPTNRSQDSVLGTQYRSSTADKGFLQPSVIAPILTSDRSHPPAVQTVNQERESLTTEAPLPNAFTRVSHTDNPSGVTARDVHLLAHEQFRTYSNSVAPNSSMTPKPRHADVKASGEVASTNDNRLDIISQQPPRPSTTLGYRQGNAEPLVHSASGAHLDNRTLGSIIQRPGTAMSFSKYAVDRPHIYAAPVTVRDISQTSILQVNPKDASTSRYDPLQSVVPQPNLYIEPSSVVDGNLLVRTGSKEQTVATSGSGLPQHKHVEPSYKTVQQLDTKAPGRLSSSHIPQEPSRMATSSQLHSTNVKTEDEPLVRPLPHQPIKGDVLVSQHGGVHDRITRTKAMTSSSTVQNSVLSVPPANGILTATAHGPPVTLLPFVPSRTMSNLESNATSNHGNLGAQMSLPALISPQIQKVHDGVHHVEQEQTQTLVASSPHVPIKGTDNVRSTGDPSISGVTAQYSNQGQITSQKPSRSKDQGKSSQKAVPSAVLHPDITYSLPPNSFPYVEPHQNTSNPQRSVPSPGIASATAYQQLVSSPTPLESPHNYRSSSHPAQRSDRQLAVPSKGSSGFHVGPSAARPAVPTSSEAPQPLHRSHPSMPSSSVNPKPPRIHAASRSTVPNPIPNSQNGLSNDVAPRSVLLDMNAQSNNQIAQAVATSSRLKDRTPSTSGKASAESILLKTPSSLTPTILKPTTSRTSIPASLSSQTSSRRRGLFGLFKPKDIQLPDPIQGDGQSRMLPRKIRKESKTNSKVESSKVASAVSQTIPPPIQVHIPILPTSGRKSPNKVFTPFRYLSTKRNRRVSEASLEAQDGTAPNTVIGSPTPSMHSSQPAAVHSPPLRDVYAATQQWRQMEAAGIREVAGGRLRRARPGVVFDVDEDRTEEDHRKFIQSQIR
ncbi:hypothetical protein H0H93_012150 [Arthromyces matolae]|nr:hypothetical protein H0H93_012150 [Arthromyces matolae]